MLIKTYWQWQYVILLLLLPFYSKAQLEIKAGEAYLTEHKIKKVYVTVDDQTTWALTEAGAVYIKRVSDLDFSLYSHTSTLNIDDLTGYSEQDMYFSVNRTKLLQVKNEAENYITIPQAGFTHINNISVVLDGMKSGNLHHDFGLFYRDWIAIAANNDLFMMYRGNSAIDVYPIINAPYVQNPEWKIKHSDIKGVHFNYPFSIKNRCAGTDGEQLILNTYGGTTFESLIPQTGQYSPKINCTNITLDRDFVYNVNFFLMKIFWGTDDGLYMRYWECGSGPIKNILPNKAVNDIKQLDRLLPNLQNQGFILAATETGVSYTPTSIYHSNGTNPFETINPVSVIGLENLKVKSLASNFSNFSFAIGDVYYPYISMCEKVIWAATDKGVQKMYALYDKDNLADLMFTQVYSSITPDEDSEGKSIYNICPGEKVTIDTKVPQNFGNQLLVQWFKDGIEINEWIGKRSVDLTENGSYKLKVTALCENIASTSKELIIRVSTPPEITFNYPPEIILCENESKELSTVEKIGYTYKWFKNELEIPGATASKYEANAEGKYRVEVSTNCPGNSLSSAIVQIKIPVLLTPVIKPSQANYCFGEVAMLSVTDVGDNEVTLYGDGIELSKFKGNGSVIVSHAGLYKAVVKNVMGCEKSSLEYNLEINPLPIVQVITSPNKDLCYGESATLSVSPINGNTYMWSTGETTSSISVRNSGTYDVTVKSALGCSAVSNKIEIKIKDQITLTKPPESRICTATGEKINLNAELGFARYYWNSVPGLNTLSVDKPGDYLLTVEDANGCQASTTYKVVPSCGEIIITNAFSPNGDGINDQWSISGLENDPNATIMIYNRYGSLVYKTKGSNAIWDGKSNGSDVQVGVYYYVISSKNSPKPLKGSLTILK